MIKRNLNKPGEFIDERGLVKILRMHPHADRAGTDGEDHINLGHRPVTMLGKVFSVDTDARDIIKQNATEQRFSFVHPLFGKFASYRHYAGWITARKPHVAMMNSKAVRRGTVNLVNYCAAMAEAVSLIIEQNPWVREALVANELPFDSYRLSDGVARRRIRCDLYMVGILERYTLALITGEPVTPEMFSLDTEKPLYAGSMVEPQPSRRLPTLVELASKERGQIKIDFQNGESTQEV